jgi:hypothetical protein
MVRGTHPERRRKVCDRILDGIPGRTDVDNIHVVDLQDCLTGKVIRKTKGGYFLVEWHHHKFEEYIKPEGRYEFYCHHKTV